MDFQLTSNFVPAGDQPEAITQLVESLQAGVSNQTLLGVTGSGKTFTIANVLERVQKPTLILSHNKTLAAQLYGEFKSFFPNNAVEYFVSYYDYYQPEAYLPSIDRYIEKDLAINQEIEKLRLSATSTLLSGRRDVVVVSSVSCLFGMGNPEDFYSTTVSIQRGQKITRNSFLRSLVGCLYFRNDIELSRGNFRVKGNTIDVFLAYTDYILRVIFWGNEIDEIQTIDPDSGQSLNFFDEYRIYPATLFVTTQERIKTALVSIQLDLGKQVDFFKEAGRPREAKRLYERVTADLEMVRELGYCGGIENYSRYFDGREEGDRPFCLLDYFGDDFLVVIDESHVTVPQIRGMYSGDASRKENLVEYGFRLPATRDNRPLHFEEFEALTKQVIYVSATPAEYELKKSGGVVVEQLVRPTGLLDPVVDVRPSLNQIDDLMEEIVQRVERNERVLITTLTKRMAEELSCYLLNLNIRCNYIHSGIETLERIKIMEGLRLGEFDVLIGVNLLREGLDLPEVSLVAILDADKEGFLRSHRALTQTAGRAARHLEGYVIMYADKITPSMQQTIDETNRRRERQLAYNTANNITPKAIERDRVPILGKMRAYVEPQALPNIAADPVVKYMSRSDLENLIAQTRKTMQETARNLNFVEAAHFRDQLAKLEEMLKKSK